MLLGVRFSAPHLVDFDCDGLCPRTKDDSEYDSECMFPCKQTLTASNPAALTCMTLPLQ